MDDLLLAKAAARQGDAAEEFVAQVTTLVDTHDLSTADAIEAVERQWEINRAGALAAANRPRTRSTKPSRLDTAVGILLWIMAPTATGIALAVAVSPLTMMQGAVAWGFVLFVSMAVLLTDALVRDGAADRVD